MAERLALARRSLSTVVFACPAVISVPSICLLCSSCRFFPLSTPRNRPRPTPWLGIPPSIGAGSKVELHLSLCLRPISDAFLRLRANDRQIIAGKANYSVTSANDRGCRESIALTPAVRVQRYYGLKQACVRPSEPQKSHYPSSCGKTRESCCRCDAEECDIPHALTLPCYYGDLDSLCVTFHNRPVSKMVGLQSTTHFEA